ncbi:hypothetical protein NAC44_17775 [Allorhizobium sp. BGMRC 0089]|uniref:hypothetical protein n=1 Tax=Allorhizobium sonneratiae TaxID=2934936 RepID=UPI00203398F1|nr:hypothetical protein [Allorhizobium sonneratiae]MCM2294179.1 hypothetical protein [Allorhizobium sonneratiae]
MSLIAAACAAALSPAVPVFDLKVCQGKVEFDFPEKTNEINKILCVHAILDAKPCAMTAALAEF